MPMIYILYLSFWSFELLFRTVLIGIMMFSCKKRLIRQIKSYNIFLMLPLLIKSLLGNNFLVLANFCDLCPSHSGFVSIVKEL